MLNSPIYNNFIQLSSHNSRKNFIVKENYFYHLLATFILILGGE